MDPVQVHVTVEEPEIQAIIESINGGMDHSGILMKIFQQVQNNIGVIAHIKKTGQVPLQLIKPESTDGDTPSGD